MKKLLLVILTLVFALTSCDGKNAQTKRSTKPLAKSKATTPFITEWNIPEDNFYLRLSPSEGYETIYALTGYDMTIDWGDGTIEHNKFRHTYKKSGTYLIKIIGTFPGIVLGNEYEKSRTTFVTVKAWGNNEWLTMKQMFTGCSAFGKIDATDSPNLSKTTSMSSMFFGATSFDHDISDWDVSNVEDMEWMFYNNTLFNQNIGKWDVSKVKRMFGMFREAKVFNQDIGDWDVSKVEDMGYMFRDAITFNQDIGDWDVSKLKSMFSMFQGASSFNQDIGKWNVSKVEDLRWAFEGATNFNQDIGQWDVSSVWGMNLTFANATSFNQDISDWDVSKVEEMGGMFEGATSFDQSLEHWDLSSTIAKGLNSMFDNCHISIKNYEATLKGWAKNKKTPDKLNLGAKGLRYKKSKSRDKLINEKEWTIVGDQK